MSEDQNPIADEAQTVPEPANAEEALQRAKNAMMFWCDRAIKAEEDVAARDARIAELEGADGTVRVPFDFRAHLQNQREWSERTFGPGERSAGVVDHIRKELCEIEAAPLDLEEWIDVVILALDGAWRAGHSPDAIITQLVAKQAKNAARKWPHWRTAEPGKAIEHEKEPKP